MSIPNLPINFKDDILAATNQKRKYNLIQNDDGTVSFEDATEYQQTGSDFGAGQVNATNDAINKIYSERILTLEEAALVTEPGFFVDAMVVSELIGDSVYNPGDSASIKNFLACGCVTTGNKDLLFYIPVSKRLSNVSSAKIVGAKGSIRQNGAYLMGGTSEDHTFGKNQWTVSIMPDLQALACRYTFSGTLDGTNNDSMTIEFSDGKIEFS